MNKIRRTQLKKIAEELENSIGKLERIKEQEDDARENMPENLEYSDAYENSEQCSDTIEDVISSIQEAINNILEIT